MSTTLFPTDVHHTTETAKSAHDQIMPFLVAVAIFLVSALGSIAVTGLMH